MRTTIAAAALLGLSAVACGATSRAPAPAQPLPFLLDVAAQDFREHRPPYPAQVREVRLGHVTMSDGRPQYLICGEFLPEADPAAMEWARFATIVTDPYEQHLGASADGICQYQAIVWDDSAELSSALQARLDALRGAR